MLQAVTGGALAAATVPWLGLSLPELACFAAFWAMQVARGSFSGTVWDGERGGPRLARQGGCLDEPGWCD
jgi:hypothetical protein